MRFTYLCEVGATDLERLFADLTDFLDGEDDSEKLVRLARFPVRRLHSRIFLLFANLDRCRRRRQTLSEVVLRDDPF